MTDDHTRELEGRISADDYRRLGVVLGAKCSWTLDRGDKPSAYIDAYHYGQAEYYFANGEERWNGTL